MKIKLVLILFIVTISSHSQNYFPTYKEVVTKLFNQYDLDSLQREKNIVLEKRAVGWKINSVDLISKQAVSELFWDNESKKYKSVNFPKNRSKYADADTAIYNFLNNSSSVRYNSLKYYGYVGWDNDLIKLYENKKPLSDSELYALGYAYSSYANGLLNDNYEFADNKINFKLPISKNSMTSEQLKTYLSFENKAINCYSELYKRNPKFETIPGEIGIKYYNEIASNFLNLRIYQNEEIAMKQLEGKDLYSENYRMYAKNMLDSCDKDAILFTAGDNDTYPILVYQVANNYRKDVLIVNTSLLQDERYVIMMKDKLLDSDGIPLSINSEFITSELSEAVFFTDRQDRAISIKNLNSIISDPENDYLGAFKMYKIIPSHMFKFSKGKTELIWKIAGDALYRSQLLMLDIIATNNWKRPIYFTVNNSDDNYLGLSKYLQFEGLVYGLASDEGIISDDETGYVNQLKLEKNMKTMYQFNSKINLPVEERQLALDYRLIYRRLGDFYLEKKDLKKAETLFDESLALYPNNLSYFSFDVAPLIEGYYKVGSFKKGKAVQGQLLENIKNGLDNYSFLTDEERKAKYERTKNNLKEMDEFYKVK